MAVDEKVKPLINRVRLGGMLTSLSEMREGVSSDGVPYVSFSGKIACDPDGIIELPFRTFEKAKTKRGTDIKNYPLVIDWYKHAVAKENDPENATMLEVAGSLTDNPYVNKEGKLIEGYQYSMKYFSAFDKYKAEIDIEGYVASIVEEVKGEEETPTGRMRMALISRDGFNNVLHLQNLVIPADFVEALEDAGWEKGATIQAAIDIKPNEAPKVVQTSGFGKQHVVANRIRREFVITGGQNAFDEDSTRAISKAQAHSMMGERKAKLDEVEHGGYLGGKTSGGTITRGSIGKNSPVLDDDDDMPF